jgi:hypothetical protein
MSNSGYTDLKIYMESPSRNKIVFYQKPLNGLNPTNIGKELAYRLVALQDGKDFSFKAKQELDKLLTYASYVHPEFGKTISISNIGILFEPDLKIDFRYLLDKYSTENMLFIQWPGKIDQNELYFLIKDGIKINIDNLSYIKL